MAQRATTEPSWAVWWTLEIMVPREGRRFVVVQEGRRVFILIGREERDVRWERPRPKERVPAFEVAGLGVGC